MKKIIPFALIAFMLIISGCQNDEIISEGPFVGGNQGVEINFVEGAPVSEFAVADSIPVKVELVNNGEYTLSENSVEVMLYGLAMGDYSLSSDYKIVPQILRGIQKDLVEDGGETQIDMGTLKYQQTVSNFIEPTLRSKVCYPYMTEARMTVCANSREIVESGGEIICEIEGEKIESGKVSSSPVQVTSFTEQLRGTDKISFRVTLENKGLGEVYKPGAECSTLDDPFIKSEKKNKVHFKIMPEEINCIFYDGTEGNEGYVRLDGTSKILTCNMPVQNTGASYTREVSVFLGFKYVQSTTKQLKILEE
jgi:hypothetical protein